MGVLPGFIFLFFGIIFAFVFSKKAIKNKDLRAEEKRQRLEKRVETKEKRQQIKEMID